MRGEDARPRPGPPPDGDHPNGPTLPPVTTSPRPDPTHRIARWAVAAAAVVFASPVVVMVLGSLRGRGLPPPRGLEILPADATLSAYSAVWAALPWATYLRNSLVVVVLTVPLTLLVGSLGGWGIRLLPRRHRTTAIIIAFVAMLVPVTAVWATRFELFRLAGVVDTLVPLVILGPVTSSPLHVLVFAWAFHQLDPDIVDAAAVDGAGPLVTWWRVALPQVRPVTLALAVLAFVAHWGNFLDPLLYLTSPGTYTAPLGLRLLQQLAPTDWPLLMAGATMLAAPAVAVFLVGQRIFLHDPLHVLDER